LTVIFLDFRELYDLHLQFLPNRKGPMTYVQRLAIVGLSFFSTLALAQQTAPGNPPPETPPPGTTQTITTTTAQDSPDPVPMTKSQIRAQRKRQKQDEKAARANAKAAKDQSDLLKQQNKSTDATEKANAPE
jgi:type IV secretory pathway VirB10-like protein